MEPFIGQIMLFAGSFAPRGWAFCNGQLLPLSENQALFAILGTVYGGDGRTTFALPDLRGRVPVHAGYSQGPGLEQIEPGDRFGSNTNTLLVGNLPAHNHLILASDQQGDSGSPTNNFLAHSGQADKDYSSNANTAMNPQVTGKTGEGFPVNNIQPSLGINFIISLVGIFPSRD